MNARNLGVVFGREFPFCSAIFEFLRWFIVAATLMKSPDPAAEFSDMAGKALTIEWLVENASIIFGAIPD